MSHFGIKFDRPGAVYAPGEVVTGKIILRVTKPETLRQIKLEATGKAEARWIKQEGKHTETYKGYEGYFCVSNRLLGDQHNGRTTLPAGEHAFSFNIQLPTNIPCSFEHRHGFVRYILNATVDKPGTYDRNASAAFMVVSPYDLNTLSEARQGINDRIKHDFLTLFVTSGELKVHITTNVSGYVPGDTIEVSVEYSNDSGVDLSEMVLKLEKTLIFYSIEPCRKIKSYTEFVSKEVYVGPNGEPFKKKDDVVLKMRVPSLPPTHLQHCSIIDISYKLYFTINVSGVHMDICRAYPIIIGTIPIRQRRENAPSVSAASCAPPASELMYPDDPPPSYEECVSAKGHLNNQREQGLHDPNFDFVPRYPVYETMPMPYK